MILINHYAIWPLIPKTIFIKHCQVENRSVPIRALSQRSFFQYPLPFPSAIPSAFVLKLFLLPQRAQLARWHTDVSR